MAMSFNRWRTPAVFLLQIFAAAVVVRLIAYYLGHRAYVPLIDDFLSFALHIIEVIHRFLVKLTGGWIPPVFP